MPTRSIDVQRLTDAIARVGRKSDMLQDVGHEIAANLTVIEDRATCMQRAFTDIEKCIGAVLECRKLMALIDNQNDAQFIDLMNELRIARDTAADYVDTD